MVWTPEQTRTFLDRARGHRLYELYHLIAFRGLRRSEACGLRWADVDLDAGMIRVRWQITQIGGTAPQGRPKSEAGERQVTFDKHTIKELAAHRAQQNRGPGPDRYRPGSLTRTLNSPSRRGTSHDCGAGVPHR
ncbi:hypothetical protein [Actinomadura nitritigenes]|uniref:hypothetical protein n=1 Tax=Actinomadura nitritigenes TaxID=134602 RepID=UPI003D90C4B5